MADRPFSVSDACILHHASDRAVHKQMYPILEVWTRLLQTIMQDITNFLEEREL